MKIKALIKSWQESSEGPLYEEKFELYLPVTTAAKVYALENIFPERSKEQIISELLTAALDELEEDFPYVPGKKVTGTDDNQDPLYEDVGLTPKFLAFT